MRTAIERVRHVHIFCLAYVVRSLTTRSRGTGRGGRKGVDRGAGGVSSGRHSLHRVEQSKLEAYHHSLNTVVVLWHIQGIVQQRISCNALDC